MPRFQYHIFNTTHATVVKFVVFTKKIVKLKMRLQDRYFDDIFLHFLHYDGFDATPQCRNFRNFPPLENFFVKLTYVQYNSLVKTLI